MSADQREKISRRLKLPHAALAAAAGIAFLFALGPSQQARSASPGAFDPPYRLIGAIPAPPGDKITSFDISWVDPLLGRYYIANRTSKDVIVVSTGTRQVVGDFKPGFVGFTGNNNTSGPDGVLTVDHKELWVGDAMSRVWVLNPLTGAQIVPPISTGPTANRADEGCYDGVDKIAVFANNADNPPFVTFFSTTTHSVLGKVVFDGTNGTPNATNGAEQCQYNPRDGMIYLSIPEVNGPGDNSVPGAVVVINPVTRAVVRTMVIPLAACTGPQGLAIGPPPQIGLGCNSSPTASNTAIINEQTGAVIAAFPNDGGGDEIWYNPGNNKYFLANRQAPGGEALFIIDAGTFAVQRLSTGAGSNAHSVAVDPVTNVAFVPTSSAATSGLCSSQGAVDANGCILLYGPQPPTPELACFAGALLGDFNGDGKADILWRRDDGSTGLWLMNGPSVAAGLTVDGTITNDFAVAGVGDFNGDGKADILWRRETDGAMGIWLMNGSTPTTQVSLGSVLPDWHVVGVRDFDGDGKADILWRRASDGTLALWIMNGTSVAGSAVIAQVGLEWEIFGVGDLNGDHRADIVWRRGDGTLAVWLMNGLSVVGSGALGSVTMDWHIDGVADFNGDGNADLLWRNDNGTLAMWLMNGLSPIAMQPVAAVGTDYTVSGLGDLDGNGTTDLLWRSNTGSIGFWLLKGTTVTATVGDGSLDSSWHSCLRERVGPVGQGAQTPFW